MKNVRTKCIIFGKGLRGKKTKLALKIVQKALKWPLQYLSFQKFSGEHVHVPSRVIFLPQFTHISAGKYA